jgi:hypothetical protein
VLPGLDPTRILFTPSFAPRDEYAYALAILDQAVRPIFTPTTTRSTMAGRPRLVPLWVV